MVSTINSYSIRIKAKATCPELGHLEIKKDDKALRYYSQGVCTKGGGRRACNGYCGDASKSARINMCCEILDELEEFNKVHPALGDVG
jgi:hypothetical protein